MQPSKQCSKCELTTPLSEFSPDKEMKDGRDSWCRPCHRQASADWLRRRMLDPEYKLRRREAERQARWARHGMVFTLDDYDRMLKEQGGRCAICGKHEDELAKKLGPDHNHETGEVRGLLCNACNSGIGRLGDDPDILQAAADYLTLHISRDS